MIEDAVPRSAGCSPRQQEKRRTRGNSVPEDTSSPASRLPAAFEKIHRRIGRLAGALAQEELGAIPPGRAPRTGHRSGCPSRPGEGT
jgi:hypothetical protein